MAWIRKDDPLPAEDRGLQEKARAVDFREAMERPRHRLRRWLLFGSAPEPVPSHIGVVEPPEPGKAGICCSGGGIRSAAFCLGALQELQKQHELRRASYLAAVSGGSYIASAISMVAKTGDEDSEKRLLERLGPFAPGSPEEQYLRNRASYLAPTLAAKLYLGWRVVLGLLVNLFFLSLPLIGLALLLTGLLFAPFLPDLAGGCTDAIGTCERALSVDLPLGFRLLPLVALGLSTVFGLATLLPRWRKEGLERFFGIWSVRLLVLAALSALLLVAVPFLVEWVRELGKDGSVGEIGSEGAPKIGAGTLALLAGVAAQLTHSLSSKQASEDLGWARKAFGKLGSAARIAVAYVAAALVGPLLLFGIFVFATAAAMSEAGSDGRVDFAVAVAGLGVLAVFAVLYCFADLTTWSLNPYYKRRLSTAFALKRVSRQSLERRRAEGEDGEADRFEARVPRDSGRDVGIAVERNFDDLVPISETALVGGQGQEWPTLLICAAANISDSAATPPGRAVTSFTFSANTVGGPLVGAVPTREIEGAFECRRRRCDLTLPAAMAMSGAAISPSMGKMTRRPLTFLMALANIRLGVWVPNPRWVGRLRSDEKMRKRHVRPRPLYLLWELLGLNRIDAKYLYVTDGGHYENLGLVELLRRGCTEIYCLDASGLGRDGVEFGALGEAIALARSELGVEIEFDASREVSDPDQLRPDEKTQLAKRDVVTAKITYMPCREGEAAVEGKLVYVRNAMTAEAPWDVRAHHEEDPRFPNNPTVDQLYTDQKFEAYRALGTRAGANAVVAMQAS